MESVVDSLVAVVNMPALSHLTSTQKFILAVSLPITLIFLYFLFRKTDGLFTVWILFVTATSLHLWIFFPKLLQIRQVPVHSGVIIVRLLIFD